MENFKGSVPLYVVSARHMQKPNGMAYGHPAIAFDEAKFLADVAVAGSKRAN